jgi:hypothetical protein
MAITQVQLSNTFNDFRTSFNDAANVINYFDTTLLTGTLTVNNTATLLGTTESTSIGTGAVVVSGGVGIAKNLYVGGIVDITATTQSTSNSTGALIVDGGVGIVKNAYIGGNTVITDTTESTSSTTGSLRTSGGAGVAKSLFVGGIVDVANTTQSTDVTTGALVVEGGAGIAKNVYVGGDMQVTGNLTVLGTNTAISTTYLNVEDNILQLSHLNPSDVVDIGFIGGYNNGANVHSGFFRDASDGTWKLFKDYSVEPSTTIDVSANGFQFANLAVDTISAQTALVLGSTTFTQSNIATTGKAIAMAIVFGG